MQACTLDKSQINCFILLSLIYSAKGEMKKSQLLIDELLEENPDKPILYVLKAYIEADKWLW